VANPTQSYWPQNESKRRTFREMKFSGLNTNYLPDWHTTATSITQVVPVGVSSCSKSQITTGMIHFGSLPTSPFSRFRAAGCGKTIFGYSAGVNTKNWYREETDMWAKFGRRAPFSRRFSSKHSVEASAVGSTSSFGRRTVPRVKAESIQEYVMTWIGYKEGDELMMDTRR
jgi:hypothetical protein